jgi:hypothetical protein
MRRFTISTDIAATPERVWQVMSDVERWAEWTPSVSRIRLLGGGPLVPGTRVIISQPKFPPALWKLTELQPGREFAWVSTAPGMRVVGRHSVEPTPAGSRATLSLELQGALGGWFGRMTRAITERYIRYEAHGLKRRSEDASYVHGVRPGEEPGS